VPQRPAERLYKESVGACLFVKLVVLEVGLSIGKPVVGNLPAVLLLRPAILIVKTMTIPLVLFAAVLMLKLMS